MTTGQKSLKRRENMVGQVIAMDGRDTIDQDMIYYDTQALTRNAITQMLLQQEDLGLRVHAVSSLEEADVFTTDSYGVGMLLCNIKSGNVLDPNISELITGLRSLFPKRPCAVLSELEDPAAISAALHMGLQGYLSTCSPPAVIVEAIRLIRAGGIYAPPVPLLQAPPKWQRQDATTTASGFSHRQQQILECLRRGMSNKQIASELEMGEGTVKIHVSKIMKKCHATNRTQVAIMKLADLIAGDE